MNAQELEAAFLAGLGDVQDLYHQIIETQAWTDLGWDSFGDWWDRRVKPAMQALSMRPTREIAAAVVEQVRAEEAELPPAQRRTQRELAEMVGSSEATVGRLAGTRSTTASADARTDLEPPPPMPAQQEIADAIVAEIDDIRRDAELDAVMSETDVRFRRNFAAARIKAGEITTFDPGRTSEVYAGNWEREVGDLLNALDAWTAQVRESYRARQRAGLRLVSGGDR